MKLNTQLWILAENGYLLASSGPWDKDQKQPVIKADELLWKQNKTKPPKASKKVVQEILDERVKISSEI